MRDQDHAFVHDTVHIFQYIRMFVRMQPKIVTAHTRVFGTGKFAETFAAENVVLNAGNVGDIDAGLKEILGSLLRFAKNFKRSKLLCVRSADDESAADLSEVPVHLRTELGRDAIPGPKPSIRRGLHP